MLADRLERARKAAGLSYREAGERVALSHTAISRYEKSELTPSTEQLAKLAKAYGVRMDYFLRQHQVEEASFQFRKRSRLSGGRLDTIKFKILDLIERRLELESFFPARQVAGQAEIAYLPYRIEHPEQIEGIAESVRAAWALGLDPIPDLADLLEARGFRVLAIDIGEEEKDLFDGLATRVGDEPVIVMGSHWPGDRQRFTLAHELGHALLHGRLVADLDEEKACNHFAGAFLLPAVAIRERLGPKRHQLELRELLLLKQEFGISMQGVAFRAQQSGIITAEQSREIHVLFRKRGWHKVEPGEQLPPERIVRFEALVYHALAEDFISESKAAELLGLPLPRFRQQRRMEVTDAAADQ
jgi:Zn-dependent peptidase ImmA (M78 family)/DNA-binding XRE family transcriptional regulator